MAPRPMSRPASRWPWPQHQPLAATRHWHCSTRYSHSQAPRGLACSDMRRSALTWHSCAEGTPYEGGVFRMKLALGAEFPNAPPKGFFTTKIFHPNVSAEGEICVNTLKKDWNPNLGIRHILTVIRCLLIDPNPESALNDEAGKLLLEAYDDFAQRARMFTDLYAKSGADAKSDCSQGAAAGAPSSSSSSGSAPKKKAKKGDKKSKSLRRL